MHGRCGRGSVGGKTGGMYNARPCVLLCQCCCTQSDHCSLCHLTYIGHSAAITVPFRLCPPATAWPLLAPPRAHAPSVCAPWMPAPLTPHSAPPAAATRGSTGSVYRCVVLRVTAVRPHTHNLMLSSHAYFRWL